ncbi:HAMP domain-containing sensor histidine kinase [Leifsonia kafniensis]|uniref:histidine kinase n=1 Tax=Leifsonia kafniensis TaxID=475957 RepID=A0ABP7KZT8_9MICO
MNSRDLVESRRAARRLALQFAALIVVLFAVLGAVVFAIVSASQAEATQRSLVAASLIDSPHDAPPGVFVVMVGDHGVQSSPDLPNGLPDEAALRTVEGSGGEVQTALTLDGQDYAVLTSQGQRGISQVAVSLHESQEELARLGWALAISGVLAAVAAVLISAWMARRAMRPLVEALALQRRFVMDASHELRTPLTLLSTRAQMLRRTLPTASVDSSPLASVALPAHVSSASSVDIAAAVEEIVQDSRVLTEILEDLLIAADPREVAPTSRLDLVALADNAVALQSPEAKRRGLLLARDGSPGPVVIQAAGVSIQRLFTALIANALDHAKTEVHVEVSRSGSDALIRVSDDGPGFAAGMDAAAFERFASSRPVVDAPNRPRHYGLGLALVAEVAARYGGRVSIEPAAHGSGAVVLVRLRAGS